MRKINCNKCGKFLFETDKSDGASGAIAQHLGFVFKMPFLYSEKYTCLFFCNNECAKIFYKENIPKDEKSDKVLSEFKDKIPELSKEIANGLSILGQKLKKQ